MTPCRLALLLLSITALHGCGDSSNPVETASDPLTLSDPNSQSPDGEAESSGLAATDGDNTTDDDEQPDETSEPGASDQPTETDQSGDSDQPVETVETNEPGDGGPTVEPTGEPDVDNRPDDDGVFRPGFAEGSDAARLFAAVNDIVAETILSLNEVVSGGMTPSDLQESCIGAFDPAVGEQLLAMDCERPLASNIRPVYVDAASLHDTDACQSSLSEGRTEDCVVRTAEVFVHTQFSTPTAPGLPVPLPGTGVEIRYAIEGQSLIIENDDDALTGQFRCVLDLTSGSALTPDDCNGVLGTVVDRITQLQDAQLREAQ